MDRARFDQIIAAYGANPRRWPAAERDAAQAFATRESVALGDAQALDGALDLAPSPTPPSDLLSARILAAAPRPRAFIRRAGWAMAACMVGGLLLGFGAGLRAPVGEDVDAVIVAAFIDPAADEGGGL